MKIKKIAAFLGVALIISCATPTFPTKVESPIFIVIDGVAKLLTFADRDLVYYDKESLRYFFLKDGKKSEVLENPGGHIVDGDIIVSDSSTERFIKEDNFNLFQFHAGTYYVLNSGKVFFVNRNERVETKKTETFLETKNYLEESFSEEIAKTFLIQNHKQFDSIIRSIDNRYEADVFYNTAINLLSSVAEISQSRRLDSFMRTSYYKLQNNQRYTEKSGNDRYGVEKPIYNINAIEMIISELHQTGKLKDQDPYAAMSNAWELLLELSTKDGGYDIKSPLAKNLFIEFSYNTIAIEGIGDSNYESLKRVSDRIHSEYHTKFNHVMRSPATAFKKISALYGFIFSLADPKKFGVKSEHSIVNDQSIYAPAADTASGHFFTQDRALKNFISVGYEISNGVVSSTEIENPAIASYAMQYGTTYTSKEFDIPSEFSKTAKKLWTNDDDEIIIGRNYSKMNGDDFFKKSVFTRSFPGEKFNNFTDAGYIDARDCLVSLEQSSGTTNTVQSKATAEIYPEPKIAYERTSSSVDDISVKTLVANDNCINSSVVTKAPSNETKKNERQEYFDRSYESEREYNLLGIISTKVKHEMSSEIISELISSGVIDKSGKVLGQMVRPKIYNDSDSYPVM